MTATARPLVLQSLTTGSEFWKETLADILLEETGLSSIYERSDADVRELEGLPPIVGALRGNPPEQLTMEEHGLKFTVNLAQGHKTGFYLDQRVNRLRVRELAKDRDVLDCFCYTGGFTVNALAGGAKSVLSRGCLRRRARACEEERRPERPARRQAGVARRRMSSSCCANSAMSAVPST